MLIYVYLEWHCDLVNAFTEHFAAFDKHFSDLFFYLQFKVVFYCMDIGGSQRPNFVSSNFDRRYKNTYFRDSSPEHLQWCNTYVWYIILFGIMSASFYITFFVKINWGTNMLFGPKITQNKWKKKAKIKSHEKSLAQRNLLTATYVLDIVSIHKIIK